MNTKAVLKQTNLSLAGMFVLGIFSAAWAESNWAADLASVDDAASYPALTETLPAAKSGECYAKVRVPAVHRTDTIDIVLKQASQRFAIKRARLQPDLKPVVVRDAATELTAIQPEMRAERQRWQIAPASSRWVRDSLKGNTPISAGELRDIELSGVNLLELPVGSCLSESYTPASFVEEKQRVLVSESTETLSVKPAKFVSETEQVVIKPAYKRLIEVPAVYIDKQQRVLIKAARSEWKKGSGPIQRIDNLTGEIMCRVDVPAVYKKYTMQMLDTPALITSVTEPTQSRSIDVLRVQSKAQEIRKRIAAKFDTVTTSRMQTPGAFSWVNSSADISDETTGRIVCHQNVPENVIEYDRMVVVQPGRYKREMRKAETTGIKISTLIEDARSVSIPEPAQIDRFVRRTRISDASIEWRAVLCETNVTNSVVSRLQRALNKEGYSPGVIDGLLGKGTLNAVRRYQQKNDLASGGLTIETLKALNVSM